MAMWNNQRVYVFPVEEPTKKGLKMVKEPFWAEFSRNRSLFLGGQATQWE